MAVKNNSIRRRAIETFNSVRKYLLYKWILPTAYRWYALRPVDKKLVVFVDAPSDSMRENFLPLYRTCESHGYRCVILPRIDAQEVASASEKRRNQLKFGLQYMKYYARCRAIFLIEYTNVAYVMPPRKGTEVIQLWHACGMIKRIAYAALGSKWSAATLSAKVVKQYPMHNTYTLVCAASPRLCGYYVESFRCDPEIVQPLGCARTDLYFDEEFKKRAVEKLHMLFPQIGERKVIVYAPTFRGNSMKSSHMTPKLNYKDLSKKLGKEYVFLTKFHPLLAQGGLSQAGRLQALNFVFDISSKLSPEEAVCIADVMISDYSSIMYDYLLMERPVISYVYDIDQYISDRGIIDPYEELAPGPYVFTQADLIKKLATVEKWFDIERIRKYRKEFMSACDGKSTERIFSYVFDKDLALSEASE